MRSTSGKEMKNLKEFTSTVEHASSIEEILNVEAHTARLYWTSVSKILPEKVNFTDG
jgi:CRISPR/Cas system-associated endonuclease Cas1